LRSEITYVLTLPILINSVFKYITIIVIHYYYFINFVMTIMTAIYPPDKPPGHLLLFTEYWKYVPKLRLIDRQLILSKYKKKLF